MIAWLLKRASAAAFIWLFRRYRQMSLDLLKIRAAVYYVRGVQSARAAAIAVLIALGLLAVMGAGFLLLPIGLAILLYGLSHSWVAACIALLVMGGLYIIVPLYILRHHYLSERAWMSFFKVEELVARVTRKPTNG
jgi:hypothetical protein